MESAALSQQHYLVSEEGGQFHLREIDAVFAGRLQHFGMPRSQVKHPEHGDVTFYFINCHFTECAEDVAERLVALINEPEESY